MNLAPYIVLFASSPRPWSAKIEVWIAALIQQGLSQIVVNDRAILLLDGEAAHLKAPDHSGAVLGHLFERETNARVRNFPDSGAYLLPVEDFVERYWGGYVAFRAAGAAFELWRDPSGAVPCYHAEIDTVHIATSRPSWLYDGGLLGVALDWTVLTQALAYRDFRPQRTALRGTAELLPGMSLTLENGRASARAIWSPWDFTGEALEIRDFSQAVEMLRHTAAFSINAWAACFNQPMLEVSGGLDSAIVAGCFAMLDRHPEALTFGPTSGDPDELPYARAIADQLGLGLRIETLDLDDIDLLKSDACDLPRPCARNFSQALDRQLARAATALRSDAFFSGGGGDSLFGHLQSALPAIDRYRREGLGYGLLSTIDDVARMGRVTIWEAVATVRQSSRRGLQDYPKYGSNRFVSAGAARNLPWPDHPWTQPALTTLPGKRAHVWAMIGIFNYMEGYDRLIERPIVSPLMSQPLFELCMRIPTWLWCQGGINRAVARKAFEDILPDAVVKRPSKGAFDGFGAALIDKNRTQLKGLLLDGALAREGLIDVKGLERSLSRPVPDGELIVDLLTLADTEAWVRLWEARS